MQVHSTSKENRTLTISVYSAYVWMDGSKYIVIYLRVLRSRVEEELPQHPDQLCKDGSAPLYASLPRGAHQTGEPYWSTSTERCRPLEVGRPISVIIKDRKDGKDMFKQARIRGAGWGFESLQPLGSKVPFVP